MKKKEHWMDFHHYMMVVYRHCQHTFHYNQLVKVRVHYMTSLSIVSMLSHYCVMHSEVGLCNTMLC